VTTSDVPPEPHYLLGHAERELRRLDLQGALYRDITERAFRAAGLTPGMAVLDVGCGTGDVALTAADIVGPRGSVLGVDRGADAIETARGKARSAGLERIAFEQAELERFERPVARSVRPGGPVVLIESWMEVLCSGAHSDPHSPLYDRIVRWKCAVVGGAGADLRAGGRLRTVFARSGLPDPTTRLEALVAGGPTSPYYEYVEESVRSMLPEARRLGLGGFDESSASGLAARLREEVLATDGSLLAWPVVTAWSRTAE
jgi:SAM-dependent methyltransferase